MNTSLRLPYGGEEIEIHLPTGCHPVLVVPPEGSQAAGSRRSLEEDIRLALAHPIGAAPLREAARGSRNAVILADDLTRPTPVQVILPILLDEFNAAGISDDRLQVVIALGTHRPMTPAEIEARFGPSVTRRVRVLNNPWQDPQAMLDLGTTPSGTRVTAGRLALEADFLLGVGNIVPHHIPGYSGGAKIVQPGITGEVTTGQTHLLSTRTRRSYLGMLENPVRAEMEQIAERVGLKAIFNTVMGPGDALAGAVYGDPRQAFRRGAEIARAAWGVPLDGLFDIVIAGSHPCDIEFWQAHKSLYPADMILKDGGTLIVVTPCPEGVAVMHPALLDFAGRGAEEILAGILGGEIEDVAAGALALAWAHVRERVRVCLVSGGISAGSARRLGFLPFASVEEALDFAFKRSTPGARIAVLPYAPETLPLLPGML